MQYCPAESHSTAHRGSLPRWPDLSSFQWLVQWRLEPVPCCPERAVPRRVVPVDLVIRIRASHHSPAKHGKWQERDEVAAVRMHRSRSARSSNGGCNDNSQNDEELLHCTSILNTR